MLKLKKRIKIRIPDTLAVAATLALIVTVAIGMPGDRFGFDGAPDAQRENSVLPLRTEQTDVASKNTGKRDGFELRLLLFRRG